MIRTPLRRNAAKVGGNGARPWSERREGFKEREALFRARIHGENAPWWKVREALVRTPLRWNAAKAQRARTFGENTQKAERREGGKGAKP